MITMLGDPLRSRSKPIPRPVLMRLFLPRSGSTVIAGAVGKVGMASHLRDFQAQWESPVCGLFHEASFSTALLPTNTAIEPYLCTHCGVGQFPVDIELDIENTEFSPGVRRMQAMVGQEAPFAHGREQMKVLAGLEVTTKSVERTAEAIGADVAQREQAEIQKALQLELPIVAGEPIP